MVARRHAAARPEVRPHLSWTQISMLSKCGIQYQFRYLDGIKKPPGVALIVGRATHESIQRDMEAKLHDGALLPAEEVRDIAGDLLTKAWKKEGEIVLTEDERAMGEKAARAAAKAKTIALATMHHEKLAPTIQPAGIEEPFRLEVVGAGIDVIGFLDIREEAESADGESIVTRIRDTKTTGKSPAPNAADTSEQLTLYGLAHEVLVGRGPDELTLDHLVATKEPKVVTQVTHRDGADYERFLMRIDVALRVLQAGVFLPAHPDSWWCSPKWCGYWSDCPFGGKGRVASQTLPAEAP